jgi:hypothetical protein
MLANDILAYALFSSLNVNAAFVSLNVCSPYSVYTGFLLYIPYRFMLFTSILLFCLCILRCPVVRNMYIQSLNRVCLVWSYIESGYVYQSIQIPKCRMPLGTYVEKVTEKSWRCGLVVSSPPATEETGARGREIESRQSSGW